MPGHEVEMPIPHDDSRRVAYIAFISAATKLKLLLGAGLIPARHHTKGTQRCHLSDSSVSQPLSAETSDESERARPHRDCGDGR
jgi:hypothetical protein